MSFGAIIFDMDGLLVDSEPVWYEIEASIVEAGGYSYSDEVRDLTIGLRVEEFAEIICRHYPKVAASPAAAAASLVAGMTRMPREKIKARPGAEDILRYVAAKDIPRAIASSSPQSIIEHFLALFGWDALMPQRYSAESMARGKPAPDIYLHAAAQIGCPPAQCLALEDSRAGTQAALAAGMTCYTVPDLSHSSLADFEGINDRIYSSLHEVLAEFKAKGWFSVHPHRCGETPPGLICVCGDRNSE